MQDYFTWDLLFPNSKLDTGMVPSIWRYYTYLNLLLVVIGVYVYRYYNLLLGSLIAAIGSAFIFYVQPGYIKVNTIQNGPFAIYDWEKYVYFDVVLHILPLFVVWWLYGSFYKKNKWYLGTWLTLVVAGLYFLLFDPRHVYDADAYTMTIAGCVVLATYIIL